MTTTYAVAPWALARSWLLIPATDPKALTRASASAADIVVIDIEDGIPEGRKKMAREVAGSWLENGRAWVRVNSRSTEFWEQDLAGLQRAPGLEGVMLAKTESAGQITDTVAALGRELPVIALVESARGLAYAPEIAETHGVVRIAFGSGDFRRDTGSGDSAIALAFARSQLVVASRVAGIAAPIDGPCISDDHGQLQVAARLTADMGMTGKLCLHERQAEVANRTLSPDADEVAWATAVVAELGADGSGIQDGSDRPALARAHRILEVDHALEYLGWKHQYIDPTR
ncbi:HpcH/HpaI aldolase/citrate lyase family protein [Nocardia carnea]|uniref:HpcH/HpaI aldolase/citrate lyase family protein n=1 Tax=Nocardia carnea TaxID=37328 RepID=UPI002458DC11|nr:CoA ester lyase [Nocardia carnea]